jgi:N-acetylmuramoyl-L-alanine amidase
MIGKLILSCFFALILLFSSRAFPEQKQKNRQYVVMIDPGHGGENMGAKGYYGIYEKYITMILSQKLFDILSDDTRFKPMITRSDDVFVDLKERITMANSTNADIFVSLHCNSTYDEKIKGFEVFFITSDGLEYNENMENENTKIDDIDYISKRDAKKILNELKLENNIGEGEKLAEKILAKLSSVLKNTENRGIRQAPYTVLKTAIMPAVIVEPGFVSNPDEGLLLIVAEYQDKIVHGIYEGILSYFNLPPLDKKYSSGRFAPPE